MSCATTTLEVAHLERNIHAEVEKLELSLTFARSDTERLQIKLRKYLIATPGFKPLACALEVCPWPGKK
jgi:hypothetical protein